MRWKGRRQSGNVLDRRGGGARLAGGVGGLGVLVVVVLALLFDVDPSLLLDPQDGGAPEMPQADGGMREFVAVVLADTEDVWQSQFAVAGETYVPPQLVLFSGGTGTACGMASSAIGPFYCPGDRRIYLDTQFFDQLERSLGAEGDFARAYVIGHEVGHHVQNLLGILDEVHRRQQMLPETAGNALSVRLELQADCLAGVWTHHADRMNAILEPGDIDEAIGAAERIGDDALQRRSQGYVVPDSFTHGTSAQRAHWFGEGFRTGEVAACDTFAG